MLRVEHRVELVLAGHDERVEAAHVQVAAHEETVPLSELYRACRVARDLLTGAHAVSRVIARPFTGRRGDYRRTFWRMALPALRRGQIESLIHVGVVGHHLIQFTRHCLAGAGESSFYAPPVSEAEPVERGAAGAPVAWAPGAAPGDAGE